METERKDVRRGSERVRKRRKEKGSLCASSPSPSSRERGRGEGVARGQTPGLRGKLNSHLLTISGDAPPYPGVRDMDGLFSEFPRSSASVV